MVHTTVNEGVDTLTHFTGLMAGDRKSSLDNPYIDWFNDMRVTFYEEADYGNDWAGGGSGVDVETTFPGSPSKGVSFLRLNTNTSELRLYDYNGSSWVAINQSDQIQVDVVPSPAPTYTTLQDVMDTLHSAGQISGGIITNGGSETINVAAGTGVIKTEDSVTGNLRFFDWDAETSLSIPTNTSMHVGIEYNNGSPQVLITATDSDFNEHDNFHLGDVINEGGTLHIQCIPHNVGNAIGHVIERFVETEHFQRASGLILGESGDGNRYVTVTAGVVWERLNKYSLSAVDTNPGGGADDFDIYYRDGNSGFTKVSSQTIWDNDSYDDDSGTLQPMTTNWFSQIWFYIELDGQLVAQYGRTQAATLSMAEAEAVPNTAPDRITEHALLIGRILFQNGGTTPQDIQSAFEQTFTSAGILDHGGLAGLLDNDHTQYLLIADIDDAPVDAELSAPISSNWAYDHQNNPTNINHLTDAQLGALHPAVTTLTHTSLTGKNDETDIKHLTDGQQGDLHTIVSTLAALDTSMTGAELDDLNMFGSGNAAWIPCEPNKEDSLSQSSHRYTSAGAYVNTGGADAYWAWTLPKAVVKGSLTLKIVGWRFGMPDADGDDYVIHFNIRVWDGTRNNGMLTDDNGGAFWKTPGQISDESIGTLDPDTTGGSTVFVVLRTFNSSANQLDIRNVELKCYYS